MIELFIGILTGGVLGYGLAHFTHRPSRDAKGRFVKRGWF